MTDYKNAFAEVCTILECLDEKEYSKIPSEVIEVIKHNRNMEYYYELDENIELKKQLMLPETKAILFNLFRDYLSTPEQKEKIIKMQKEERQKNQLEKQQMYSADIFINNKEKEIETMKENYEEEPSIDIVQYKENIFKRLLNAIKRFLRY